MSEAVAVSRKLVAGLGSSSMSGSPNVATRNPGDWGFDPLMAALPANRADSPPAQPNPLT